MSDRTLRWIAVLACVAGAVVTAAAGNNAAWGWFLFVAVLL